VWEQSLAEYCGAECCATDESGFVKPRTRGLQNRGLQVRVLPPLYPVSKSGAPAAHHDDFEPDWLLAALVCEPAPAKPAPAVKLFATKRLRLEVKSSTR
jgi:hypothetical protein